MYPLGVDWNSRAAWPAVTGSVGQPCDTARAWISTQDACQGGHWGGDHVAGKGWITVVGLDCLSGGDGTRHCQAKSDKYCRGGCGPSRYCVMVVAVLVIGKWGACGVFGTVAFGPGWTRGDCWVGEQLCRAGQGPPFGVRTRRVLLARSCQVRRSRSIQAQKKPIPARALPRTCGPGQNSYSVRYENLHSTGCQEPVR